MSHKSMNIREYAVSFRGKKTLGKFFSSFLYQKNVIPEASKFLFISRDPKT